MRALLVAVLLASGSAQAHAPGRSLLFVRAVDDGTVALRWDVALADADLAVGLDQDGDGVGPAEAARGETALFSYALARLAVQGDGRDCTLRALRPLQIASHRDGRHLVLRFTADCTAHLQSLALQVRLLRDRDPAHRSLTRVQLGEGVQSGVFAEGRERLHWQRAGVAAPHWLDRQTSLIAALALALLLGLSAWLWRRGPPSP